MPQLRLVVLALQDRLSYGTTFETAMAGLFGPAGAPAATGRAGGRRRAGCAATVRPSPPISLSSFATPRRSLSSTSA
jgi:uncharacterized membrane protein (UPF0182 family)